MSLDADQFERCLNHLQSMANVSRRSSQGAKSVRDRMRGESAAHAYEQAAQIMCNHRDRKVTCYRKEQI